MTTSIEEQALFKKIGRLEAMGLTRTDSILLLLAFQLFDLDYRLKDIDISLGRIE